ncbi:MAG: Fic family protein [Bacteroidales bacterium]|jgi:Fic family protein|nr:Fic family protein [Bacteroidales bacterium]
MNTALKNTLDQIDVLKERLQSVRPVHSEALEKIKMSFEIEYTYESNRIEGNTLTLQETALIISEGITIGGKSLREHLEVINHTQAISFIKEIVSFNIEISEYLIKQIHSLILFGINHEQAGVYRNVPVMIVGSKHIPPQPYLIVPQMEQFIFEYKQKEINNIHPVLIAAYLHDELVKIHPFIDGNGRVSRLLMNLYLLSKGYTLTILKGNNEAKLTYYTALETSHIENNNEPFNLFVATTVKQSLEEYLKIIDGNITG